MWDAAKGTAVGAILIVSVVPCLACDAFFLFHTEQAAVHFAINAEGRDRGKIEAALALLAFLAISGAFLAIGYHAMRRSNAQREF